MDAQSVREIIAKTQRDTEAPLCASPTTGIAQALTAYDLGETGWSWARFHVHRHSHMSEALHDHHDDRVYAQGGAPGICELMAVTSKRDRGNPAPSRSTTQAKAGPVHHIRPYVKKHVQLNFASR